MALTFTLGALVRRCQQRANKLAAEDGQIQTGEWKEMVSEYYADMHATVTANRARYFETEATITANGATSYTLPSDHMSTEAVSAVISGTTGARRNLWGPLPFERRAEFLGVNGPADWFGFEGAGIALYPAPLSGTYKHLYVPQPTDYSAAPDPTLVDVINIYGLKFILWGVASIALHRGESSQVRAVDEITRAREQLETWATQRALSSTDANSSVTFDEGFFFR